MNRAYLPLPRLWLASAFALAVLGAAPALSEPAPAPAPRELPDPLHPCTVLLCLPRTGATVQATSDAQPTPCATVVGSSDKLASDPEEGGQVARTAPQKPKVSEMTVTKRTDTASTKLMDTTAPSSTCPAVQH